MKKYIILLFAITGILHTTIFAATKTSTGSGNWTTAASWNPSGLPVAGDVVSIQAGHTITVTSNVNSSSGSPITINVSGTLAFSGGGSKLRLSSGSTINLLAGSNLIGNGSGSSQQITIGGAEVWAVSMGNFTGPRTINASAPLPVVWLSFTGNRMPNGTVQLNWSTASELSNSHFEVEKTTDGKTFTKLDEVKGNGTTTKISKYTYTDKQPGAATVYYRLKQVDFNSKFEYSKLVAVKGTANTTTTTGGKNNGGGSTGGQGTTGQAKEKTMVVKPMAIVDIAQFKIEGQDQADVIVELVNGKGAVVVSKNTILFGGAAKIDLSDAPKGVYKMVVRLASDKTKIGSANVVKK
jgi:hypothetical protein